MKDYGPVRGMIMLEGVGLQEKERKARLQILTPLLEVLLKQRI